MTAIGLYFQTQCPVTAIGKLLFSNGCHWTLSLKIQNLSIFEIFYVTLFCSAYFNIMFIIIIYLILSFAGDVLSESGEYPECHMCLQLCSADQSSYVLKIEGMQ